jgi:hypothetical protein
MKLALLTHMTSKAASTEQDTPANIQKFQQAIEQIKKTGVE